VVARAVSVVGDGIGTLALVLHVRADEGTGTAVALLLLAASLPRLLSPWVGALADRADQRTVLAGGELGQGALLLVAAVSLPPLPVLLVILLAKYTMAMASEAAGASAVPALVDDADLPAANAVLGGLRQGGEVLGPLLGGLIMVVGGVRAGLAVDALTFLVSVPLLLRLPALPAAAGGGTGAFAGVRHIVGQPVLRSLTVGFFLAGLAAGDDVAIPFLAGDLGGGAPATGALYAAVSAGLILGYLALTRLSIGPFAGVMVGAGVAAAGNLGTGLASALVVAVAFQAVRGVGLAAYDTGVLTTLQRTVPRELLGRVVANAYGAVNVAACVGLLVAGPLLDATSARTVLLACAGAGLVSTAAHLAGSRPPRWPSRTSTDA
jgi:MFS family permease